MSYEERDKLRAVEGDLHARVGTRAQAKVGGFQETPMNPNDNPALRFKRKAKAASDPVQTPLGCQEGEEVQAGELPPMPGEEDGGANEETREPVQVACYAPERTAEVAAGQGDADMWSRPGVATKGSVSPTRQPGGAAAEETTKGGREPPIVQTVSRRASITNAEGAASATLGVRAKRQAAAAESMVQELPDEEPDQEVGPSERADMTRRGPARRSTQGSTFPAGMQHSEQTILRGESALLQCVSPGLAAAAAARGMWDSELEEADDQELSESGSEWEEPLDFAVACTARPAGHQE